MQTEETQA